MTPAISSLINNILLIPGSPLTTRKNDCLTRCNFLRNSTKQARSSQNYVLPLSTSIRLFPQFRSGFGLQHKSRIHIMSATGTDLAVEEADPPVADKDSGGISEIPAEEESPIRSNASATPTQSKRSKPARKSEMPPVKPEELVPGATFTGKVRSIQPFGAFVDFGAFTDGLVHVSRLSDSFVKEVGNVVSVGQEVKVRLVEANKETGRISLTMRESDDISQLQQRKDAPSSNDKARSPRKSMPKSNQRKDEVKKTSKFVKGQDLEGTVKNLTRSGAFISLPEGEEGFLPASEELDEGFGNIMGGSSLQAGQEVSVRVLRITRGQVTLTMKKEDVGELDSKLSQGVVYSATNPFLLAFRKNKDIAAFLDEKEKEAEPAESSEIPTTSNEMGANESKTETELNGSKDQQTSSSEGLIGAVIEDDETSSKEVDVEGGKVEDSSYEMASEESVYTKDQVIEEAHAVDKVENDGESDFLGETADQSSSKNQVRKEVTQFVNNNGSPENTVSDSLESVGKNDLSGQMADLVKPETANSNEVTASQTDVAIAKDEVQIPKTPVVGNEILSATIVEDEKAGIKPDKNSNITTSNEQINVPTVQESANEESLAIEEVENETDGGTLADNEINSAALIEDEKVGFLPDKNDTVTNSNGQSGTSSPKESITKAISPALVKQLREETGAGMMDCKKALSETGGDLVKAQEFLRKKGLASADKKASRATAEGRIGSYIHDSRIGVLIEVNCETDFVSRGEIFKDLVDDLAMQVAACPQVEYLVTDDVPKEIIEKEREIEMQKEDLLSRPEQIRSKIVEGRIRKRLEELALLEQPYIKNDKMVVKDWVKQKIATVGENMKVKRFVRYNLGEGLEKKSQDFAAEVAAQTAAKPVVSPGKEQPAVVEDMGAVDKPPKAAVSAALVKQLREETGAGMMDCKKALSETGGDLEKAQEYLRKKGLSTADKKSSRLAAEGRIGSYVHDSRIGVLIEVNCETDFVGRSEKFKELVDDLAMQIVACPQVKYVSIEDIPESIVRKEKELEMQRDDLLSKPEAIRERIVEGRVSKRLGEMALLEQPFIKNDSILVKDLVKQTVAALGENIKARRFVRLTLGETNESAQTENEA
ncbi:hypothetical protein U1Q18_028610 [Sarracenia purpurea var. burkii]